MGFTRAELEAFRNQTVDDLLGPELRLLFVGINPGLWTAAVNTHFAHPGNRFYPALARAGIIDLEVDRSAGMTDAERAHFTQRGIGITNLVQRRERQKIEATRWQGFRNRLRRFVATSGHPKRPGLRSGDRSGQISRTSP